MFNNLKYKKILFSLVILLLMQNQVLAGVNIVSKTLGNTTTYYLNNKAIGTYRTKKMENGFVEVETCYNGCQYSIMTPMQAESYRQVFKEHIKYVEEDLARLRVSPEEIKRQQLRQKQERQKYLADLTALEKQIETYQDNLPNIDFRLVNSYKSDRNTLIKDTYAVFTAPKNLFDLIPDGYLFDGDLQRVYVPGGYDINYYLANSKKPVFVKSTVSKKLHTTDFDKEYLRFNYIHNKYYKNPALAPANGIAMFNYEPESEYGISLNDVRKWFEAYKNTLAPYLAEYEKVKSAIVEVEKAEAIKYRNNLLSDSSKIKQKYPDKLIGDFISDKQKEELKNKNPDFGKHWQLSLEQIYNLKLGSYYMAKGIEVDINNSSDKFLKEQDYFLADKSLIKELKRNQHSINSANEDLEFSKYMEGVQNRIKSNWKIHSYQIKADIKATVIFKVAKDGRLLDCSIIKPSGDKEYDKKALKAIWLSSPFAPLPKSYTGESVDIFFTFSLNKQNGENYNIIPIK